MSARPTSGAIPEQPLHREEIEMPKYIVTTTGTSGTSFRDHIAGGPQLVHSREELKDRKQAANDAGASITVRNA